MSRDRQGLFQLLTVVAGVLVASMLFLSQPAAAGAVTGPQAVNGLAGAAGQAPVVDVQFTCGPGRDWDPRLRRCVPDRRRGDRRGGFSCGPGFDWDARRQQCVPDRRRARRGGYGCGPGYDWHPELGRCLPDGYRRGPRFSCGPGMNWDAGRGRCVPDWVPRRAY